MRQAAAWIGVVALGTILAFGALGPRRALADETVEVPAVEGRGAEQAIATLERLGLDVRVIEVAGPTPDVVHAQDPQAGLRMRRGGIVTIRVGIEARIETRMPDVRGKPIEQALRELAAAYDLEVRPVPVERTQAGRVVRTVPAAGTKVWFRAPVTIFVAEKPQAPGAGAPPVVPELPAVPGAPEPLALPDAPEVRLPPLPAGIVRMPELVGLAFAEAQRRVREAGLVPEPWFFPMRATAWAVYAQKIEPGQGVRAGSRVPFRVVLPRPLPDQVPAPDVVGLDISVALRIARDLGLGVRIEGPGDVTPRGARVEAQRPAAGSSLARGDTFVLNVGGSAPVPAVPDAPAGLPSLVPPPDAVAPIRVAPSVVGRSVAEAKALLEQAGFTPALSTRPAPEAAPDRIFEQEPPAGLPVQGRIVRIIAPEATGTVAPHPALYAKVPDVVNRTPAEAEAVINETGLRAVIEPGPEAPGVPAIIIAQSHHPGALIKQGTRVTLVTGAPEGVAVAQPPAPKKDHPNALEKVGRFFRKTHKKAWGTIKGLFK